MNLKIFSFRFFCFLWMVFSLSSSLSLQAQSRISVQVDKDLPKKVKAYFQCMQTSYPQHLRALRDFLDSRVKVIDAGVTPMQTRLEVVIALLLPEPDQRRKCRRSTGSALAQSSLMTLGPFASPLDIQLSHRQKNQILSIYKQQSADNADQNDPMVLRFVRKLEVYLRYFRNLGHSRQPRNSGSK